MQCNSSPSAPFDADDSQQRTRRRRDRLLVLIHKSGSCAATTHRQRWHSGVTLPILFAYNFGVYRCIYKLMYYCINFWVLLIISSEQIKIVFLQKPTFSTDLTFCNLAIFLQAWLHICCVAHYSDSGPRSFCFKLLYGSLNINDGAWMTLILELNEHN